MGRKVDIDEYNKGRKAGRNATFMDDMARGGLGWMNSKDFDKGYMDGSKDRYRNKSSKKRQTSSKSSYSYSGYSSPGEPLGFFGAIKAIVFLVIIVYTFFSLIGIACNIIFGGSNLHREIDKIFGSNYTGATYPAQNYIPHRSRETERKESGSTGNIYSFVDKNGTLHLSTIPNKEDKKQ